MTSVLIVEDEVLMQNLLYEYFVNDGFHVYLAGDGIEALDMFRNNKIDLVVLDIMMPKLDGFSVCRKIRQSSDALIIMLTAREDEDDKLYGYELGADDYITKPFSPKVLLAKVHTLLKRFEQKIPEEKVLRILEFGDLAIELDGYRVTISGEALTLTKKEYELLAYLANNKGIALQRDRILNKVWGDDYFGDGRVLDTNIKTLRKKLGDKGKWIKTVINVGYKFEVTL